MTAMPCISIRQPWAGTILVGGKDVENRTWKCPARLIGQPILIHAGKQIDVNAGLRSSLWDLQGKFPGAFGLGGIVGIVTIACCIPDSPSPWAFPDHWHWVLADPKPLPFMPCPGRLGIFQVKYPFMEE